MNSFNDMISSLEQNRYNRRLFIGQAGFGILGATAIGKVAHASAFQTNTPKTWTPGDLKPVNRKALHAKTEKQQGDYFTPVPPGKRIGFALVGLGNLTLGELMPAFGACKYAKPVALVSGDATKAKKVAKQYGIEEKNIYDYDNFDRIKDNPEIDAVYIVLPNSMHHEFTIRAAKAGKHVLCEKPLANSVKECEEMIAACKAANVKLMTAYRIQYEPNNRLAMQWVRNNEHGEVKLMECINTQDIGDPTQWRLKKALSGGGVLPDIGIYCLNTCRFLTGEEPESVLAYIYTNNKDKRFKEVEETVMFQLHFPSGIMANCTTSYSSHMSRRYRLFTGKGAWFGLDPAFDYKGLKTELSKVIDNKEWKQNPAIEQKDQFALEMDHFAECIMNDQQPYTPGEEGLQDMRIIEAIYRSAKEGRVIQLEKYKGKDVFRGAAPKEQL